MRCLVTGAAGFLGSHMVEYLNSLGHEVFGVDNYQSGFLRNVPKDVHFKEGDIREKNWWANLPEKLDFVFHYAANASVPQSTQDPVYDLSTNALGTLNIMELARQRGAKAVVISSAAVYGNPQFLPTPETHPLHPISIYGVSKLASEGIVEFYQRTYGTPAEIVRYFNCFGPRQPRYILFDYLKKTELRDGPFVVLGDGRQQRTQLYALDAVKAAYLVGQIGDGKPYNIGSDQVFTVTEIAEKILRVVGQSDRPIAFSGHSWPGDIQVMQPSLTRVRELGFTPQIDLETGMSHLYEWWQKTLNER